MATGTDVDVKEHPESFVFVSDMPGCKSHDVKVRVENDNVLVVRGERKPDDDIEGETKFLQKQRRPGHFAFKFMLPENANVDHCKAICRDGVLVVTVPKIPPPDPHAPRFLDVPVA